MAPKSKVAQRSGQEAEGAGDQPQHQEEGNSEHEETGKWSTARGKRKSK